MWASVYTRESSSELMNVLCDVIEELQMELYVIAVLTKSNLQFHSPA